MHLHLRQGDMAKAVARFTAERCHRVLVMPNTEPPITTAAEAAVYKEFLQKLMPSVDILTTIKFMPSTTPAIIREAAKSGVTAVKLYPSGVTTNSHDGITEETLRKPSGNFLDCIEMIRISGMTLCMHGEMPGSETKDREEHFLEFVEYLALNFPKLRMVLEHISTEKQVDKVRWLHEKSKCHIAATITVHHLFLTMDDVIGDKLQPHNFCKPIAKWKDDRHALRQAAMSGQPCFFLGSDSAPHDPMKKECSHGCAGCFTAPVLTESLIEMFDRFGSLDMLPGFMSHLGNQFYGFSDEVPVRKFSHTKWKVPLLCNGVRPWRADEYLEWRIEQH